MLNFYCLACDKIHTIELAGEIFKTGHKTLKRETAIKIGICKEKMTDAKSLS